MNKTLGENIARLRKGKGMTQEELANEMNISYQAVSKWENGISSPDISNIKRLALLFGVSIDMLFGLELIPDVPAVLSNYAEADENAMKELKLDDLCTEPADMMPEKHSERMESLEPLLAWEDDNTLRAVLFLGRKLLSAEEVKRDVFAKDVRLEYRGEALNVFSCFAVNCEGVKGNVEAGGDVDCGEVGGNIAADGDVDCGDVRGSIVPKQSEV